MICRGQLKVQRVNMTHRTEARLFEYGEFTSHSGNTLKFKLECDAFDMDDWNSIASIIMTYQTEPFRSVEGIPRGGIPLANALRKYATGDPTHQPMIVDDVFTTGKSFIDFIRDRTAKHMGQKTELSKKVIQHLSLFDKVRKNSYKNIIPLENIKI